MENNSIESIYENQNMEQKTSSAIATELVLEKLKQANINVITDQSEMQAILDAGIDIQKMAAHYGTNQNIETPESFNGYGVYVLSVNEENARNLGLKIASKKYGNSFYINNQPLQEFLQERNFSPYWQSVISQLQNPSNETLLNSVMTSDVKGNPVLLNEQNQLSTLCSLNLINYKREQTYLYSVEIPDNDGTNYLYYDKTIGLENADRINEELSKLGTNWKVSRNDTGNSVYFNILSNKVFNSQKQASEFLQKVGYVGMETSNENYIIFDDREMNINNRVQYMITENGELYGFAYNGQIYVDKNLMNSNVLAHEYTHLWDNYTKNQNPELWKKGKDVFKKTAIWNEVINDPSYQNIRNNEDEILSECHARICGKFAQSVLERIAKENGENAKNAVIDWNKEIEIFVTKEFGFATELGNENYFSELQDSENMEAFLAAPMKDLMNGVGFEKEHMLNKTSSKPDMQIGKTSISSESPSFPVEPQLSIGSRANHILLQTDKERQLLTPLGKESELSEEEWNYAHSSNFINMYGDWELKIKQDFLLSDQTVVQLSGNEFSKKDGFTLTDQVEEYFNNINNNIESPFFGRVVLDREGADDSLSHGMGRLKAIAYAGVPNVIKNGVIINSDINHKDRGYNSYVIAAPIEIAKEKYICEVVLKQNRNETRFYLHEVTEQKKFLDRAFVTNLAQKPAHQGTMLNILDKTLSVNTEISCPLTVNGEPEKHFVEEYMKSIKEPQKMFISNEKDNSDYVDPIEALEESYNTPQNPPTEEDIENEKILHDKYIQQELDKTVEDLQVNGGLSEAAMEAELAAQEASENYEEDSFSNEEDPVLTFNDTNGNPHYPQEIISILENFQKVEPSKWNVPTEEKTAVFHLMQITEIEKGDFENSLAKLQEYMNTEEFKREEKNYSEIFTPILLSSLGQDFDEATHTFSSEKYSYKFSTNELKEEIRVVKGEIKSILDNDFSGGNVKLTQDFQNEFIEKGLVKPEEKFVLINEVEAVAHGTKIKEGEPFVTLTIPVDNDGKKEFVQTKYYHVSALEEPQKLERTSAENQENNPTDKNIIIYGETKVPEFAMITQHGLENFKDMIIDSYEESSGTYLLKSVDGKNNVRVSENTLNVLVSDEYSKKAQDYTQDTKTTEKMIDIQYNDFFQPRDNCANNFRHNLAVFCRKEANSPLDALKVANSIISQMSKEEKQKTKELLNLLRKDGQTVNEVLIETYHEAVKETPLNEDYIKHNRYEKMIARPMYDTLSTKGEKIDRDFNLKIGDSVDITFKVDKNPGSKFSLRKESIYQNCTIVSASKEGNVVTLMDGNKSFYDVPRDTFLKEYAQKQKNEHKMEKKVHRQQSMQIEIGR